jgi:hypothetical protein
MANIRAMAIHPAIQGMSDLDAKAFEGRDKSCMMV